MTVDLSRDQFQELNSIKINSSQLISSLLKTYAQSFPKSFAV